MSDAANADVPAAVPDRADGGRVGGRNDAAGLSCPAARPLCSCGVRGCTTRHAWQRRR